MTLVGNCCHCGDPSSSSSSVVTCLKPCISLGRHSQFGGLILSNHVEFACRYLFSWRRTSDIDPQPGDDEWHDYELVWHSEFTYNNQTCFHQCSWISLYPDEDNSLANCRYMLRNIAGSVRGGAQTGSWNVSTHVHQLYPWHPSCDRVPNSMDTGSLFQSGVFWSDEEFQPLGTNTASRLVLDPTGAISWKLEWELSAI